MFASRSINELELRKAAATGDLVKCKTLVEQLCTDVNAPGKDSLRTALHLASKNNHVDVVRYLIKNGAKSTYDKDSLTPYNLTTTPEIRRVLQYECEGIEPSCNDNISNLDIFTYGYQFLNEDIDKQIRKIESLSAFESFMNQKKLNPNSYINGIPLINLIELNYKCYNSILVYLLKNGANPNMKAYHMEYDAYENTALHSILASESTERSKFFIRSVAAESAITLDTRVKDIEGKTTLIIAALLRNTSVANLLIENFGKAAIDIQDNKGRTALHYAYLFGNSEMINLLSAFGANQELLDKDEKKPKDMLTSNVQEIKRALLAFHIDPDRDINFNLEASIPRNDRNLDLTSSKKTSNITIYKQCITDRLRLITNNSEIQYSQVESKPSI